MSSFDEIQQLIEDLDDLDYFPDAFALTPGHWAALELIRRGEIAFAPVLEALLFHPKYVVRGWSAWILGQWGDTRAIPSLQSALQEDSLYVRKEAHDALSRLQTVESR